MLPKGAFLLKRTHLLFSLHYEGSPIKIYLNEKPLPPPLSRMDRRRLRQQAVRRAGRRPDLSNR
jgi:hypothetical protein